MRKFFLMGALLLSALTAYAGVEITGFVDVLGQAEQGSWSTSFGMGAYEVDFATELSDKVCFEGAVVIEGEEVGLGQTLVDIGIISDEKLGLQTGLLDIPFGLDYQVFATPDRKLVSPPLVTELMMDGGWGDIGINLHGALPLVNYNLYVVNGMGEDEGAVVNQLSDNNNAKTIGGRLNIASVKYIGFGGSYAQGTYDVNEELTWQRAGAHIQFSYSQIEAKGEYIYGKEEISKTIANEHSGYYLQLLAKATPEIYGVVRHGQWKPEKGDAITRITIGLGYDFIENVSLRIEYQVNTEKPEADNNLLSSQVVISF